jgi:hypothetical protein
LGLSGSSLHPQLSASAGLYQFNFQAQPATWESASLAWVHRVREDHYRKTKDLPVEAWLKSLDPGKALRASGHSSDLLWRYNFDRRIPQFARGSPGSAGQPVEFDSSGSRYFPGLQSFDKIPSPFRTVGGAACPVQAELATFTLDPRRQQKLGEILHLPPQFRRKLLNHFIEALSSASHLYSDLSICHLGFQFGCQLQPVPCKLFAFASRMKTS